MVIHVFLSVWAFVHNLTAGPCWHWVVEAPEVIAYPLCRLS